MADKSVPQLGAIGSTTSGDLYHVVRDNVDYKIDYDDLSESIRGGAAAVSVLSSTITIPTASVLTLNGTPIVLVSAPSASYAVEILSVSAKITFNSVAYATNTTLDIYTDTATDIQFSIPSFLASTVTKVWSGGGVQAAGAGITQLIGGKAVYVKVNAGNPTAGNSDVKIYVTYRLITL